MSIKSKITASSYSEVQFLIFKLFEKLKKNKFCAVDKNYSTLLDVINELDSGQYLWLRNDDDFREILNKLFIREGSSPETENIRIKLPSLETSLDDTFFDNKFDKLILRLINSNAVSGKNKLSDVINISRHTLQRLPGIGRKYIELSNELNELYQKDNLQIKPCTKELIELDLSHFSINFSSLTTLEAKSLEKFYHIKGSEDILHVLNFNKLDLQRSYGRTDRKLIKVIFDLKQRLEVELQQISSEEISYHGIENKLIRSTEFKSISIQEIGTILLEDIDNFLDDLTEKEQEIFQFRWGFVEQEKTLEEIGKKHSVTREYIRQRETVINTNLLRKISLTKENIWKNLKHNINSKLASKMKDLFDCFDSEDNFYRFLGYSCGNENINKIVNPRINKNILNAYFAEHGEPCSIHKINEYIESVSDLDDLSNSNVLDYLERVGKVRIKDEKVSPTSLTKHEAAACVLAKHSQGLPWLDIAKLNNAKDISKFELYENKVDQNALFDSNYIYIAGKGIYKNTRFINFTDIDLDLIFDSILLFFDETSRESFHLNEVYNKSPYLREQNYYVIRYIVKLYGENYGFYFNGKSQTDSIGLEKNFKKTTQKEVILQAMTSSNKPMTKPEVANLLKSHSISHASFYLDQMIADEQVVQVDRMLYTTPQIAYKDINLQSFIDGIEKIMVNEGKPVDPSIFQYKLNNSLHKTYSKYFYISIAKLHSNSNNWFRKGNLYSLSDIEHKNLTDAINKYCKSDYDMGQNIEILTKYIAITKESAQVSIKNWQANLK